ncbi:MAG: FTR1 family protein, partial [Nevskiales bacterium]
LSFIAVYREVFETVLFYRALWAQGNHAAIAFGFVAAAAALVGIAWAIFYYSMKLPVRQFFSWSSAFIVVLAVIFTGKGVAALQEAGAIPVHSVDFVSIPMLGVYPTLQVLLMQISVLALVLGGFAWNHLSARRAAEAS